MPAVRAADGSRRAQVSSLELTPAELRAALEAAELEIVGRMRYSSNATFLVEAKIDGVELSRDLQAAARRTSAVGLPARARCASARSRRTSCPTRSAGTSCRSRSCVTVRSANGAVQRFVDHDPDEHYFTLRDEHEDRFREFAVVRRARQQHRSQGRPLPARRGQRRDRRHRPRAHVPRGLEAAHRHLGLRRRAPPGRRRRRRVPRRRRARRRARSASASAPCSTPTSSTRSYRRAQVLLAGGSRSPTTGTARPGPSSRPPVRTWLLALVDVDVVDRDDVAVLRLDEALEPGELGDRVVLRAAHLRR